MSKKILSFKNYIHEKKDNVIVFYKYKIMFIPYVYIHVILTMSYMLVLELDTISVSYLTTNITKLKIKREL